MSRKTSYSKIMAFVQRGRTADAQDFNSKKRFAQVSLHTEESFNNNLELAPSGEFDRYFGEDLSNLFYPYGTGYGASGVPTVASASGVLGNIGSKTDAINIASLWPYSVSDPTSPSGDTTLTSELHYIGGDSRADLVSGDRFYDYPSQLRDRYNTRGLGFRFPMVGVGWGYDINGNPVPSGSSPELFAGDVEHGHQVDPKEYVAAPVDIRYDPDRKVWVAGGGESWFWAVIADRFRTRFTDDYIGTLVGPSGGPGTFYTIISDANPDDANTPNRDVTGYAFYPVSFTPTSQTPPYVTSSGNLQKTWNIDTREDFPGITLDRSFNPLASGNLAFNTPIRGPAHQVGKLVKITKSENGLHYIHPDASTSYILASGLYTLTGNLQESWFLASPGVSYAGVYVGHCRDHQSTPNGLLLGPSTIANYYAVTPSGININNLREEVLVVNTLPVINMPSGNMLFSDPVASGLITTLHGRGQLFDVWVKQKRVAYVDLLIAQYTYEPSGFF
jgi:hypothetical protein